MTFTTSEGTFTLKEVIAKIKEDPEWGERNHISVNNIYTTNPETGETEVWHNPKAHT